MLPACAGVILALTVSSDRRINAPRMRGGDPLTLRMYPDNNVCSPHARG